MRGSNALPLLAAIALLCSCDAFGARDRLVLASDPGSRYDFRYVQDRQTGLWVHQHCEIRVPVARELPDPISTSETGDLLSFTEFSSMSMGSAGVDKTQFKQRDGYKVWLWRDIPGEDDYKGRAGFGVQVKWPNPQGGEWRTDPMEHFDLPPVRSMTPYVWTPWRRADKISGGVFAGWERVQGMAPSEPIPNVPHPFEMRCRAVLFDGLFVPVEAEDPNVTKPDPGPGASK